MSQHEAKIIEVSILPTGSELVTDHPAGAMTLQVADASDFDDDGGQLQVDEAVYYYLGRVLSDEEEGFDLLALSEELEAGALDEAEVLVVPLSAEKEALVLIEDFEDPIIARIDHSLFDRVDVGVREENTQESVWVELRDTEWVVVDLIAKTPRIDASFQDPQYRPPDFDSDGLAPSHSPTPQVSSGLNSLYVSWEPISNPDPVVYDLHVGVESGFAIAPNNLVTTNTLAFAFVTELANGSSLVADTPYYLKLVARDEDGAADPSPESSGTPFSLDSDLDNLQASLNQLETDLATANTEIGSINDQLPGINTALADLDAGVAQATDLANTANTSAGAAQTSADEAATAASNAQATATSAGAAAATAQLEAEAAARDAQVALSGAENRVRNGSFENDLAHWSHNARVTVDDADAYEGNKSALISNPDGLGTSLSLNQGTNSSDSGQRIPVEAGQVWRWEAYYKTSEVLAQSGGGIRPLKYHKDTGNGSNVPGYANFDVAPEWTRIWFEWTVDGVTATITPFRVAGAIHQGEWIRIDQARVVNVTEVRALEAAAAQAQSDADAAATAASNAQTAADQAASAAGQAQSDATQALADAYTSAQAAGQAQQSADGKNAVWYRDTAPAGTGHSVDDTWFKTNDGNKIHRWNGTEWLPEEFGAGAVKDGAISSPKLAAEVNTSITNAQTAADSAQSAADSAATAASQAQTAGDDAAAAAAAAQNDATQALSDASSASTAAGQAQARADDAFQEALDANDVATAAGLAASNAQSTADGKGKVIYGTTAPTSSTPGKPGYIYWLRSGNTIIGQYLCTAGTETTTGNTWVAQTLTNATIATLDAGKITTGFLGADRIAGNSITAAKMVAGTITAASGILADAVITSAKIADLAVSTAKIADAAIATAKIGDLAVTNAKIGSIDAAKITAGTIDAARIGVGSITAGHMAVGTITAESGVLANAAITEAKIANAAVTNAKIANLDAAKITSGLIDAARINTLALVVGTGTLGGELDSKATPTDVATAKEEAILAGAVASGPGSKTFHYPLVWGKSINGAPGSLVIRTPITFSNYMTKVVLSGYNYNSGNGIEIDATVGFYAFSQVSFPNTAQSSSGSLPVTIRLARDADDKVVLIVDNEAGIWHYPKLNVVQAALGQSTPPDSFRDGWSCELETDLTPYTIMSTPVRRDLNDSHGLTQKWRATGTTTINGGEITADSVTAAQLAANAVTANKILAGAVTTDKMTANSINGDRITANTLTAAKIIAGTVTATQLATNSVTAIKIAANAVTAAKIEAGAVTADKIFAGAVTADKIAAGAITADKLSADAIDGKTITGVTITGATLRTADSGNRIVIESDNGDGSMLLWSGLNEIEPAGLKADWSVGIGAQYQYLVTLTSPTPPNGVDARLSLLAVDGANGSSTAQIGANNMLIDLWSPSQVPLLTVRGGLLLQDRWLQFSNGRTMTSINGGLDTVPGNSPDYLIPHGLGGTPKSVVANSARTGGNNDRTVTINNWTSTHFQCTVHDFTGGVASNNSPVRWIAFR